MVVNKWFVSCDPKRKWQFSAYCTIIYLVLHPETSHISPGLHESLLEHHTFAHLRSNFDLLSRGFSFFVWVISLHLIIPSRWHDYVSSISKRTKSKNIPRTLNSWYSNFDSNVPKYDEKYCAGIFQNVTNMKVSNWTGIYAFHKKYIFQIRYNIIEIRAYAVPISTLRKYGK
jgi:hypothetical protein